MIDSYTMPVKGELTLDELIHFGKMARRFGFSMHAEVVYDATGLTVSGDRNE